MLLLDITQHLNRVHWAPLHYFHDSKTYEVED